MVLKFHLRDCSEDQPRTEIFRYPISPSVSATCDFAVAAVAHLSLFTWLSVLLYFSITYNIRILDEQNTTSHKLNQIVHIFSASKLYVHM